MRRHISVNRLPVESFRQTGSSQEPDRKSITTTVLIPLGSVLVAALGLLVQAVPWWVTAVVITYVLVVALVGLVPVSTRFYHALRDVVIDRRIVRQYLPLMHRFVTTLSPNLEDSRTNTIFQVWRGATSLDQGQGLVRPDQLHQTTLQEWLSSIDVRLKEDSKRNFAQLCSELGEVVSQYNRLCEQAHREIETLVINGKLEEHKLRSLKQEWNNARDKHNQTIKVWEDIAKNINRDTMESVCIDYYSMLKTI